MSWDDGEPKIRTCTAIADRSARSGAASRTSRSSRVTRTSPRRCSACSKRRAFHVLRGVHARVPSTRLCLAGGCAMNSVANGKIRAEHAVPARSSFSPRPATTARRSARRSTCGITSWRGLAASRMEHAYWGTEYDAGQDRARDPRERRRRAAALPLGTTSTTTTRFVRRTAAASPTATSSAGSRDAWSGARARSAIAASSPTRAARDMRDIINQKIKFRETLPALCAVDPRRGDRRVLRRRRARSVHDPGLSGARREARRHSGRDARRWLGPAAVGQSREQSALLGADSRLRRADRRAGSAQYVVQRERTDRRTPASRRSTASCAPTWTCS